MAIQLLDAQAKKDQEERYSYLFLKAYCLAQYLEGKCAEKKLTIVWVRKSYV